MIIYLATNKQTNKMYVGQTVQKLENRIKRHLNGRETYFARSIRKYGLENFEWKIIEECSSKDELDKEEKRYIQIYNTLRPNGYNLTLGGDAGTYGWKPTKENRENISKAVKKYWDGKSKEYKKTWGVRLSKINSGKNNPMYGKKRPELSGKNNPACRPEVREKIRQAALKRYAIKRGELI